MPSPTKPTGLGTRFRVDRPDQIWINRKSLGEEGALHTQTCSICGREEANTSADHRLWRRPLWLFIAVALSFGILYQVGGYFYQQEIHHVFLRKELKLQAETREFIGFFLILLSPTLFAWILYALGSRVFGRIKLQLSQCEGCTEQIQKQKRVLFIFRWGSLLLVSALLLFFGSSFRFPAAWHGLPFIPLALLEVIYRRRFFPEAISIVGLEKEWVGLRGPLALREILSNENAKKVAGIPPPVPAWHKAWVFLPPILILAELMVVTQGSRRFSRPVPVFAVVQPGPVYRNQRDRLPNNWIHGQRLNFQRPAGQLYWVQVKTMFTLDKRNGPVEMVQVKDTTPEQKQKVWRRGRTILQGNFTWSKPRGTWRYIDPAGTFDETLVYGKNYQKVKGQPRLKCPTGSVAMGRLGHSYQCHDDGGEVEAEKWDVEVDGTIRKISIPYEDGFMVFEYDWNGILKSAQKECAKGTCNPPLHLHPATAAEIAGGKPHPEPLRTLMKDLAVPSSTRWAGTTSDF